jgi:hypothetical protein
MARRKKEVDISGYEQLKTITWVEALEGKRKDVGVVSQLPNSAMLSKSGQKIRRVDHENKQYQDVVYDSSYVYDYYYKRLIKPLNFFVGEDFDDTAYNTFCKRLRDYAIKLQSEEIKESFREKARELAVMLPNKSEEQWLEILVNSANDDKEETR